MVLAAPGTADRMAGAVRERFSREFGTPPAVVARAPGRVNLIGEHTDYNAGLCLPVALPHATYAAVAARPDRRVRILSAQRADRWEGTVESVGPGQVHGWASYVAGVLWALRRDGIDLPGVDVLVDSTVPLGAGLSSSAALECSVAVALAGLAGQRLDAGLRQRIVAACVRAETEVAGAPTGGMDQTVAMLASPGSALLIDFEDGSSREVPLPLEDARLALLVVDTRVSHALVDGGYGARRADCESAAAALGLPSLRRADLAAVETLADGRVRRRARHVVTEIGRVRHAVAAIGDSDWRRVGELFAASHASLRNDFEVSCAELDLAVEAAVSAGAIGARMTGGGFGGSAVAVVPRDRLDRVMEAVDDAFAAGGLTPPGYLLADPAGAADLLP